MAKTMDVWVSAYHHRHGVDLMVFDGPVTEEEVIALLSDWEADREEFIDIDGPLKVRQSRKNVPHVVVHNETDEIQTYYGPFDDYEAAATWGGDSFHSTLDSWEILALSEVPEKTLIDPASIRRFKNKDADRPAKIP